MRLYIGNKMVGKGSFNEDWFIKAAAELRALGHEVFSPAERDRGIGFNPQGMAGTMADLDAVGFSRRQALLDDWTWIGTHSEGMVAGPDWHDSPGTISEMACHFGLHLPVWEYDDFLEYQHDPVLLQVKRKTPFIEQLRR